MCGFGGHYSVGPVRKKELTQNKIVSPTPHLRTETNPVVLAQAVSGWLPTAAARVQNRVYACGICGGQSGAGAGFLRVLQFPLLICIPPITPQSPSPIMRGWYNRPVVAAVPKVPPHNLKKIYPVVFFSVLFRILDDE
jgi:hypothetical protein